MRMWRKGTFCAGLVEYKPMKPLWKIVWEFLKKSNIELPYYPVIPLLNIHPEKPKT